METVSVSEGEEGGIVSGIVGQGGYYKPKNRRGEGIGIVPDTKYRVMTCLDV